MNIELTNDELGYLYKRFKDYIDEIDNGVLRNLKYVKGQLGLYRDFYSDQKNFDLKTFDLYEKLISEEIPKDVELKKSILKSICSKFQPYYEALTDADENFAERLDKTYFTPSHNIEKVMMELQSKFYDNDEGI